MLKPSNTSRVQPLVIIVGLIIVASGTYLWLFKPLSNLDEMRDQSAKNPLSTNSVSGSQYVTYSDDIVAKTSGTKILFFHAPWCPQCRALEASIKAGTIPTGVTIIKVDYDSHQALRQQYGVTIQTTLVKVDDTGNLIKKYVAYDEPTLSAVSQNLLP